MDKIKKILQSKYFYSIAILIPVLMLSLNFIGDRVMTENKYKRYETVMELNDIKSIASMQNRDDLDVVKDFTNAGVNTIVIFENTIDSLKSDPRFKLYTTYSGLDVEVHATKEGLAYVEKAIKEVINDDRKIYYKNVDTLVIEGKLSDFAYNNQVLRDFTGRKMGLENNERSVIEYIGLGFFDDDLQKYTENNIKITLRPIYIYLLQDSQKSVDRYMRYAKKYATQNYIIFGSDEILGGEKNVEYLQQKLEENNMMPVSIETSTQDGNIDLKGLKALIQNMNYKTVRLFSTLSYIQERYEYGMPGHHEGQEIMNTYYRAITERNIRLIYFRPFHIKEGDVITDMNIYKQRFDELNARLDKFYSIKPVSADEQIEPLEEIDATRAQVAIAILGVVVVFVMVLQELFALSNLVMIIFGILEIMCIPFALLKGDSLRPQFALLATIVFPSLSIIYLLKNIKKYRADKNMADKSYFTLFAKGIFLLARCSLISFVGAICLAVLYGRTLYFLEFSVFSGVKLSQMAPLLITIISYLSIIGVGEYFDNKKNVKEQLVETMQKNIKVWQVVLGFILIGVLGMMIVRSGHDTNVEPSSMELLFRNVLEYITPARPRNKAIFLGFPATIIFVMLSSKKRFKTSYIILALASTIGQANILNTFSHIRTPFIMSVYRVAGEYIFATVLTFVLVIIFVILEKILKRIKIHA